MATTNFVNGTVIVPDWLNDVDAMTYDQTVSVPWKTITWTNATVTHSGAHVWSGNQTNNGTTTFNGTVNLSNGALISGQYTPSLTNVANITTSAANANTTYIRVGNVVTVAGTLTMTPTANSVATTVDISLPVASALAAISQLSGGGRRVSGVVASLGAGITAEATGDTARMTFLNDADSGSSRTWAFQFQYVIA
jgi:hypothetical protein